MSLLEVEHLTVKYRSPQGDGLAVDDVSFELKKGDILGLAGESGCGKTTLAWSIIQLLPSAAKIDSGKILLNGQDLLQLSPRVIAHAIRGKEISIISQNPQGSFNPTFKISTQIMDVLRFSKKRRGVDATGETEPAAESLREAARSWLEKVGIPDAGKRIDEYPHQFSGGMKQRVMIAMAFITNPKVLIADEPTTALDVTLEAQILELLKNTIQRYGTSTIYITHDLGVISKLCDIVMIMYAGKVIEIAKKDELFEHPLHPYTKALLDCIPGRMQSDRALLTIPGTVPNIFELPGGCSFHPRCQEAKEVCRRREADLVHVRPDHAVRCFISA
jgi:oligopeptide/dipeptide ABC transporter ATP-binding protein